MAFMSFHDNPGAFIFGILGNMISFMVFLAPMPTFYRIIKKKSTEDFQSLPYLVALFSSMLWLYYAMVKRGAMLLVTINSFGFFIEIIYIVIFIIYATNDARKLTIKIFLAMNLGCFGLILSVTHFALHGSLRVVVLGWICVSIATLVFAAPLSIMAQVIRTKSVEFMPFNLSLFLTISAITWFGYGLFLKDICIALPNIMGFALGLIQMILYAIYRKKDHVMEKEVKVEKEKELVEEPMKAVVVVNPLGGVEVIPIIPVDAKSVVDGDVKEEKKVAQENEKSGEAANNDSQV
ncbi:hypothetical protein RIF29_41684 [Crotalaria pallida]|uniref:Bidirectional sugar transporter SWEET n=1 Tax=Crotalaria pallida TaxID=3830 RepID=A0AAN9E5J2_CROPI